MCNQRECAGAALLGFGAGLILGTILQSVFFPLLLALLSIAAGCLCMRH